MTYLTFPDTGTINIPYIFFMHTLLSRISSVMIMLFMIMHSDSDTNIYIYAFIYFTEQVVYYLYDFQ